MLSKFRDFVAAGRAVTGSADGGKEVFRASRTRGELGLCRLHRQVPHADLRTSVISTLYFQYCKVGQSHGISTASSGTMGGGASPYQPVHLIRGHAPS
jgi:hypothetical protein